MKFLQHFLWSLATVSGILTAFLLGVSYIGFIVFLYVLGAWWSGMLATFLSLVTLALVIGTASYLEERDTERLTKRIEEIWRRSDEVSHESE